jgi:hypothetical protein
LISALRENHAFPSIGRTLVGPDVPVAIGGVLRTPRRFEPRMFVGRMIYDEIDDHADAALFAAVRKFDEIPQRAVARVDAVIVGDVVAVILAGRRLERHQPDGGDAKPVKIVKPPQ